MIDREQLGIINQTTGAEIDSLRRQLQGLERDTAMVDIEGNLADGWEAFPVEVKRRVARALTSVSTRTASNSCGASDREPVSPTVSPGHATAWHRVTRARDRGSERMLQADRMVESRRDPTHR